MNICTIVAKNYLAYARVLAESFREHHPDGTCYVLVIDDVDGYIDASEEPFELVAIPELDIEEFENMATIYSVLELSTAVKPWLLRYLLNELEMESLVYLDPDIRVYDRMDELEPLMRDHGLVLIPHVTTPIPRDGEKPTEADILIAGTYNLGFIGVNNDSQTHKLLDWWSERLGTDCLVAPERGYFVDQRWIDFVHGLADDFYVLRDPAYNIAYWNLHGRDLTFENERYYADGRPLRFFHFSGYDPENRHLLSKHQSRIKLSENPALIRICNEYGDALIENGYEDVKDWPYTYDTLPNGIKVDQFMRRLYCEGKESGELEVWLKHNPWTGQRKDPDIQQLVGTMTRHLMRERLKQVRRQNQSKRIVGDKTPLRSAHTVAEIAAACPGAKVVHIVRDGRDLAVSSVHHRWNNTIDTGGPFKLTPAEVAKREAYRSDPNAFGSEGQSMFDDGQLKRVARKWKAIMHQTMQDGQNLLGSNYCQLFYENLLRDPVPEARKLFKFLGADADEEVIRGCVEATSFKRLSGREEGEEDPTSFYRKGVAGDWRCVFTREDRQAFAEEAGDLLIQLGYEEDGDRHKMEDL